MKSDVVIYPHNRKAYKKVCEAFQHTNKTCVIQPTGTGKMYIAMQLIDDNPNKRILFLTSYRQIILALAREMEKCGITHSKLKTALFCTLNLAQCTEQYDYIIIDEFHRAGAPIWNMYITCLLQNNATSKILGLTATPIRYMDNERDMADELFGGNIASQMTLAEAVGLGILKMPKYVCAIYSLSEELDRYKKRVDKIQNITKQNNALRLIEKARRTLEQAIGLADIFANNIKKRNGRYIVFCRNFEHMDDMIAECKSWFQKVNSEVEIYTMKSVYTHNVNEAMLNQFSTVENNSLKLLFVIDMLNEGVHIDNIDGCIMLRPTESTNVFVQQLGRAIAVDNIHSTIIFDIVNNATQLNAFGTFKREAEKIASENGLTIHLGDFEIHEYLQDFIAIASQIDMLLKCTTWEEWLSLVKEYKAEFGNLLIPERYITTNNDKLGQWIRNRRDDYVRKQLTETQIKELEELGMVWGVYEARWYEMFGYAKLYFEKHGNLNTPVNLIAPNGKNIHNWIKTQRIERAQGNLPLKYQELLNSISIVWEEQKAAWQEMYGYAEQYFNEFGHLSVPNSYKAPNGKLLAEWLYTQKKSYKRNRMSDERKELLEAIGMVWDAKESYWREMFGYAQKYYQQHGNLFIPINYPAPNKKDLGKWFQGQLQLYRKGKMPADHIKQFESIGIVWNYMEWRWQQMFGRAKIYYSEHDNLIITAPCDNESDNELRIWICGQRRQYHKKAISEERIKLLESIGMVWDTKTCTAK